MFLERFYDDNLAQASYLIGAETTDAAVVIDPNREIEQYLRVAAAKGFRITHVTETHIHADFVSGARDVARNTGAKLLLSGEGGTDWQYRLSPEDAAVLLMDGDSFLVGELKFDVLHTPGHTPEHLVFFVTDSAKADRPMGVFTGDFLFVGDVGRPDLLERVADARGSMESSARSLYQSLRRMRAYPEYLQVWPGHGAGSACGKELGAVPSSTLGYERLFNWAFGVEREEDFVAMVLAGQPEPPRYFARMKQVNRDGPPPRGNEPPRQAIDARTVAELLDAGSAVVVDSRPSAVFAAGFIPGTLNIPAGTSFTTWAGALLPPDRDVVLLVGDDGEAGWARVRTLWRWLSSVGIDRVSVWSGGAVFDHWRRDGRELASMPTVDAATLAAGPGAAQIVDVRGDAEWSSGHIPGAVHVFLGDLPDESARLSRNRPIVVACQGGTRASIAASLLRANGFSDVTTFPGGLTEWRRLGFPVETDNAVSAPTSSP